MSMHLLVNRTKERKNKFRKRIDNGDILSLENFYECTMFELHGVPRIEFQADPTRDKSLHDLNLNEVRDVILSLMGKKASMPKNIKIKNAPFIRRIVHIHVSEVPAAKNATLRDSTGGSRSLMQDLGAGEVHCVKVDKEIDEQSSFAYKLLTVPFSRAVELAPPTSTAGTHCPVQQGTSNEATHNGAHNSDDAVSAVERKAAADLAQYVLSVAQMHLWGYSWTASTHHHDSHHSDTTGDTNRGDHRVHSECDDRAIAGRKRTAGSADSGDSADSASGAAAKRAKVETATTTTTSDGQEVSSRKGLRGDATDLIPSSHSEAVALLHCVAAVVQDASVSSEIHSAVHGTFCATVPAGSAAHDLLWAGVPASSEAPRRVLVASVDCEMCKTTVGEELTRVSLLGHDGSLLLDALVQPEGCVLDYRTQYSGITAALLEGVTTTLAQVQVAVLRLIAADTILIGHSLDCDLRALQLLHRRCVDTAITYPHPRGYPLRLKLRKLAEDYLHLRIQTQGDKGHDSTEDAKAALQLALLKAENGPLFGVKKPELQRCPMLEVLDPQITSTVLVWQGSGEGKTPDIGGAAEVVVVEAEAAVSVQVAGTQDDRVTTAAVAVRTEVGAGGVSAEESATGPAAMPQCLMGGNAVIHRADSCAEVVQRLCEEISSPSDPAQLSYEVRTLEDKAAGPVSSWVEVEPSRLEGASVVAVQVPKCRYLFGHIAHPGEQASAEFASTLRAQIDQVRTAAGTTAASSAYAGSTLLLVTAQDSLEPVLALLQRRRTLSRNTMATAMWSAQDELQLKELRKHNLAFLTAAII